MENQQINKICTVLFLLNRMHHIAIDIYWRKDDGKYLCPIELITEVFEQVKKEYYEKLRDH